MGLLLELDGAALGKLAVSRPKVNSRASYFLLVRTAHGRWHGARARPPRTVPPMAYEKITFSAAPTGVATIALDEPDTRNALSDDLLAELDPSARGVSRRRRRPLRGARPRRMTACSPAAATSAGSPLTSRSSTSTSRRRCSREVFALLGELGKPSICAANGHVLAGALGLALACDLVIASDAARFGTPEINIGLFPFMIMALIYRNVGPQEDRRADAHGRADLGRRGRADRDRQPGRARRPVRDRGRPNGRRSSRASRRS